MNVQFQTLLKKLSPSLSPVMYSTSVFNTENKESKQITVSEEAGKLFVYEAALRVSLSPEVRAIMCEEAIRLITLYYYMPDE